MPLHEHAEIHAAPHNFINIEAFEDIVVSPVFQSISCEFEFIRQCMDLGCRT